MFTDSVQALRAVSETIRSPRTFHALRASSIAITTEMDLSMKCARRLTMISENNSNKIGGKENETKQRKKTRQKLKSKKRGDTSDTPTK
jgi:hypothetical protein